MEGHPYGHCVATFLVFSVVKAWGALTGVGKWVEMNTPPSTAK